MTRIVTILLILITSAGCLSQKQGISGSVLWVEGNQMPGPGKLPAKAKGVAREIHIYEPVTTAKTTQSNGFYTNIQAKLIKTVTSDDKGMFSITLPPGKYSVFIKESGGLFANIMDGDGVINPIEVQKNQYTEVKLEINYMAAY